MPLPHVLGLRKCLVLALVTLAAQALELSLTPPNIIQGEICQLSWTANGTDPRFVDLYLSCDFDFGWQLLETKFGLKELNGSLIFSRDYNLTRKFPELVPPTTCRVWAEFPLSHFLGSNQIRIDASTNDAGTPTSLTASSVFTSSSTQNSTSIQKTQPTTTPSLHNISTTTTAQGQPTTTLSPHNKSFTGEIVGGLLGGLAFFSLLVTAFIMYRRWRRPTYPTLVPLTYDPDYVQPSDTSGRLAEVLSEKAAVQRQRDQLRTELETENQTSETGILNVSQGASEARLRQQVELMSERILELEAQQRELGIYGEDGEGASQPPPDYSVISGARSTVTLTTK